MSIKKMGPSLTGAVRNPGATSIRPNGEDKTGGSSSVSSDRVEFSLDYRDLARAIKSLMGPIDIRTEKVEYFQKQLAGGYYRINPAAIAGRMLEEIM